MTIFDGFLSNNQIFIHSNAYYNIIHINFVIPIKNKLFF